MKFSLLPCCCESQKMMKPFRSGLALKKVVSFATQDLACITSWGQQCWWTPSSQLFLKNWGKVITGCWMAVSTLVAKWVIQWWRLKCAQFWNIMSPCHRNDAYHISMCTKTRQTVKLARLWNLSPWETEGLRAKSVQTDAEFNVSTSILKNPLCTFKRN